ncbi:MAG: response regulator [Myxococcota bacterium]
MRAIPRRGPIVLAEDDPDDRLLTEHAFRASGNTLPLVFLEDGEELTDYLFRRGRWVGEDAPRPELILLDLNMPRKDGREALAEIKADPELRRIPIVVLTTSSSPEDVRRAYALGANSYITKPGSYEGLMAALRALQAWWFGCVTLPE